MTAERPLVFVGGTGRSGTHVLAHLLGPHSRFYSVPIECRFHVNPQGFPDLLEGRVTKEQFLRKLKQFWWYRIRAGEPLAAVLPKAPLGRQTRGLHKIIPRERFDAAVLAFDGDYEDDHVAACRELFEDLLMPLADEAGKPGLVEMSCFTVAQAPTLVRLFPEAKIVHTVRDGRDAGSSKVSKRQKREHPRDACQGVGGGGAGSRRPRRARAPCRPSGCSRSASTSSSAAIARRPTAPARVPRAGGRAGDARVLRDRDDARERPPRPLARGALRARAGRGGDAYEEALDRIDGEGYLSAPLLRRVYERLG